MTPFNEDKIRPRLVVRAGNKNFSWGCCHLNEQKIV
jgi:hypothetical protein